MKLWDAEITSYTNVVENEAVTLHGETERISIHFSFECIQFIVKTNNKKNRTKYQKYNVLKIEQLVS